MFAGVFKLIKYGYEKEQMYNQIMQKTLCLRLELLKFFLKNFYPQGKNCSNPSKCYGLFHLT